MKYELKPVSFGAKLHTTNTELLKNYLIVGVEAKKDAKGFVAYLTDVDNLFNHKNLAEGMIAVDMASQDVLGMTYKDALKMIKTGKTTTTAKKRISSIDDFIKKCNYHSEILSQKDMIAVGALRFNRPAIVKQSVEMILDELEDVRSYAKHPIITKVDINLKKGLLKRDSWQHEVGFISDYDFVEQWAQQQYEYSQKLQECYKAIKEDNQQLALSKK